MSLSDLISIVGHAAVGVYPLDEALDLVAGRKQLDMQKVVAKLVTEVPYDEAHALLSDLTDMGMGSERMHTLTNQVAEGLTVLDVAPSREEIEQRFAAVVTGSRRRPVHVCSQSEQGIDKRGHH